MVLEQIELDWSEISILINTVHEKTREWDDENIGIIGITRGGLIPAVLLSHKKPNSTVLTVGIKSYNGTNRGQDTIYQHPDYDYLKQFKTIYLVDDICDTGLTFKNLIQKTFKGLEIKTLSLLYRKNNIFTPSVFGQVILDENWRIFPWEKE